MAGTAQKQPSLCDACHFPTIKPWNMSLFSLTTYNYLSLSFSLQMDGSTYLYNFFKVFKFMLNRDLRDSCY